MSELDKTKLVNELQKVIKTLDFIERSAKEAERTLLKEIRKGECTRMHDGIRSDDFSLPDGFKWEKNQLVDEFGQFMQQKHDNLLKGSMIVHA